MSRFLIIFALACYVEYGSAWFGDVTTVDKLDLPKYLGRWYEMYRSLIPDITFERNALCVTADYGLRPDGKISVLNSARLKTPDGKVNNITGYGYTPDTKQPGKLKVKFPSSPNGDYWIVKLGPETFGPDGKYEYSIITSRFKLFLFVLARDPVEFNQKYNTDVVKYLKANGYKFFWNRPRKTFQGSQCKYP